MTPVTRSSHAHTIYSFESETERVHVAIDPEKESPLQPKSESNLIPTLLDDFHSAGDALLQGIAKKISHLTKEEDWIVKAATADLHFEESDFIHLDKEFKLKLFYVANKFGNLSVVRKLKLLGMAENPIFNPGLKFIAPNMDLDVARAALRDFLKNLRHHELLFTHAEFKQMNKTRFVHKADNIGRILGRNFIAQIAAENHLKSIKVPKKIVVLREGLKDLAFVLGRNGIPRPFTPLGESNYSLTIYAERIKPLSRNLTLQEALELLIVLEKTGYNDISGQNIFFAEDGIYFIDTEFENFDIAKPLWKAILSYKNCLAPQDQPAFEKVFAERKCAWENQAPARKAEQDQLKAHYNSPYKFLIDALRKESLTYPVAELLSAPV